jgi:GNAT superfamily N-acetyltransferase
VPGAALGYVGLMVTVRLAAPAEAVTLRVIAREAYQHYVPRIGREPAPMSADYDAAVRAGQAWVAVGQGEVIGFAVLIAHPGHLLLENLAVRPSRQGRGAGSRLLALAEDQARRRRLAEIRLYTNEAMTDNLAYYPRRGYTETHRAEQDGFRRVYFRKHIA